MECEPVAKDVDVKAALPFNSGTGAPMAALPSWNTTVPDAAVAVPSATTLDVK
jgi:hypothetical protein